MARSDGAVYIETLVDTQGFGRGMNTIERRLNNLSGAVKRLGGVIASVFAIQQLVAFGKEAIKLGSDLEEVQNVVDVTFTSMSKQVDEFAKNAQKSAGLSETMAKRYVGTFGAMAKAFGFVEHDAFNMSTTLAQLAGDVASFYNITQDEAYTKLKSVFSGETETLKDLGIVMTQSALDAYAMAKGFNKTTRQMTEQEKVALRYQFILDQLSTAQGDFARTSDSWANQVRILSLNFDTFKANVGKALINIFTPFLKMLNHIVEKMAQFSAYFVAFSEMLFGKSSSGGGSPNKTLETISSGYEDVANSAQKAKKAQAKYLSGLDEIRTFTSSKNEEGGGSSGFDISGLQNTTGVLEDELTNTADLIAELEQRFPNLIEFLKDSFEKIKEIIHDFSIGDFYKAGQDISDLVVSIFDFFSNAIDSVDWKSLGNKIGDFLAGIDWLNIIRSALKLKFNIWKAMAELWFGAFEKAPFETILLTAFALLNFTPIGKLLSSKLLTAFLTCVKNTGFASKIAEAFSLALGGAGTLRESFSAIFGTVGTTVAGILSVVGGAVLSVKKFVEMLTEGFNLFDEVIMLVGIGLTALGAILLGAPAMITGVVSGIIAVLSTLVIVVKDNWKIITETLKKFTSYLKTTFTNAWTQTWEKVGNALNNVISNIKTLFNKLKTIFESMVSYISSSFSNAWKNAWEGISNIFKGIINSISSLIENFVNNAINKINRLLNGINSITGFLGINIPTIGNVNIPKLATGAVIPPNAPFLAMLGDQKNGTNVEAPLSTIEQAVRNVVGNGTGQVIHAHLYLDGKEILTSVIDTAKFQQATTGLNPLLLG